MLHSNYYLSYLVFCIVCRCLRALSVSKNVLEVTDYDDKKRRVHTARSLGAMLEATNQVCNKGDLHMLVPARSCR